MPVQKGNITRVDDNLEQPNERRGKRKTKVLYVEHV
jgi:hypothetical protein